MTDLRTLDATYWQPQVGVLGGILTDLDDIHQCILTILSTPRGSDPHRPDFAVNLLDWVDKPINAVRPQLVQAVVEAISKWERRASIQRVTVESTEGADLAINVFWIPSGLVNAEAPLLRTTFVTATAVSPTLVTSPFTAIPFSSALATYTGVDGGTA